MESQTPNESNEIHIDYSPLQRFVKEVTSVDQYEAAKMLEELCNEKFEETRLGLTEQEKAALQLFLTRDPAQLHQETLIIVRRIINKHYDRLEQESLKLNTFANRNADLFKTTPLARRKSEINKLCSAGSQLEAQLSGLIHRKEEKHKALFKALSEIENQAYQAIETIEDETERKKTLETFLDKVRELFEEYYINGVSCLGTITRDEWDLYYDKKKTNEKMRQMANRTRVEISRLIALEDIDGDEEYWQDYEHINQMPSSLWTFLELDDPYLEDTENIDVVKEGYPYLEDAQDEEQFKKRLEKISKYIFTTEDGYYEDVAPVVIGVLEDLLLEQRKRIEELTKTNRSAKQQIADLQALAEEQYEMIEERDEYIT